jgi:alpha-tubulin suppressor-like RCC1 family protein
MRYVWGFFALSACSQVSEVLTAVDGGAGEGGTSSDVAGAPSAGSDGAGAESGSGGAGTSGSSGAASVMGVTVDAGDSHGCAIRSGLLACWGGNADGQLGLGDRVDRPQPSPVSTSAEYVAVATGVAHTCALTRGGTVVCFGANQFGQLGQGTVESSVLPVSVSLPARARTIAAGANTTCAVLEMGALYCWGRNREGNIGLDDQHPGVDQLEPIQSGTESDWLTVSTGDGHTLGVRAGGWLFGWGRNTVGNLGLGQIVDAQRRAATRIGEGADWVRVVAGQDGGCGIRGEGGLFCWGDNSNGSLGLGDRTARLEPTSVPLPSSLAVERVSLDTFHACAIDRDGALYCWGRNVEGQLGTDDNAEQLSPAPVGSGYTEVAVGRFFTCAVTKDERVWCTGENDAGQLGVGDTARRARLTEVQF